LREPKHTIFPCRTVWQIKAPFKVALFIWTASLQIILKINNLRKKKNKTIVVDQSCMCKKTMKS
jgi:hypothetical protein